MIPTRYLLVPITTFAIGLWGCAATSPRSTGPQTSGGRLFDGLGDYSCRVTTASAEAQRYFDQGLTWAYAFNHDEAIRSFSKAATLDPSCGMAWWGIALCNGPHINNPLVPPERSASAWKAVEHALQAAPQSNVLEQALIRAVSKRYASTAPADRRPLDEAYADAMKAAWEAHRDSPDVGVLYAEALMDLQPWDLWTPDGRPKGRATEILAVLEHVLAIAPEHPGANHLYIHAVEASPNPEKGLSSAEQLRNAVPISGHLTHMPSHIDVQVGRWAQAADQNVAAIESDRRYRKACSVPAEFYNVYMAHNHHFLAFASMMEGRSAAALQAAREMIAGVPAHFARSQPALVDPVAMIVPEVLMRFGRWDELLREPAPPDGFPISRCLWHFTRGVAYAAKGQVEAAEREQIALEEATKRVPAGAMMSINSAEKCLNIARHMLAGEIAFRRGEIDKSVAHLRQAVEVEDSLLYMEPPDWIQPTRHTLGAVLTSARRFEEAEKVYREDLANWPENGWSLHGLAMCLRGRSAQAEADLVQQRFDRAWQRADIRIETSCLCVPRAAFAPCCDRPLAFREDAVVNRSR